MHCPACRTKLPESDLQERGFTIIPGPPLSGGHEHFRAAFDKAVEDADPADVSVRSSTRIDDFVNRGEEFDSLYTYGPLLRTCEVSIGKPFKLSGMRGRILEPGAPAEPLHVDVKWGARDWPIVGGIFMVDAFTPENGATRFVPRSHLRPSKPDPDESEVLACGPAGSLIIFNGSVWHGHSANRSKTRRRSIQLHFVARDAQESTHHAHRMRADTLERISALARYVLDV